MNSIVNSLDAARPLSEVPAEELTAVSGGINTSLWDEKSGAGVIFMSTGQILYSTGRRPDGSNTIKVHN
jgi:hypothetical protein